MVKIVPEINRQHSVDKPKSQKVSLLLKRHPGNFGHICFMTSIDFFANIESDNHRKIRLIHIPYLYFYNNL